MIWVIGNWFHLYYLQPSLAAFHKQRQWRSQQGRSHVALINPNGLLALTLYQPSLGLPVFMCSLHQASQAFPQPPPPPPGLCQSPPGPPCKISHLHETSSWHFPHSLLETILFSNGNPSPNCCHNLRTVYIRQQRENQVAELEILSYKDHIRTAGGKILPHTKFYQAS